MKHTLKPLPTLCLVIVLVIALTQCTPEAEQPMKTESDRLYAALKEVSVDTVTESSVPKQLLVTGKIVPHEDRQIKIYPQVSGIVTAVYAHSGYSVKAGEVLAELRSSEMAGLNSERDAAEAALANAKRTLTAQEELLKGGLTSERDVEAAKNDYKRLNSEFRRAEQVLQINGGGQQANYKIRSSIDGFVIDKRLTHHMQLRSDNDEPVFTISDISTVWGMIKIYESDISLVHQGDSVTMTTLSYPDKIFRGTIEKIYHMLDPDTKTMRARINIANNDLLLKPEMFISARVKTARDKSQLNISAKALIFDNDKYYVIKRMSDGPLLTEVSIGEKVDGRVYILAGLKAGDEVVCSRQLYFYEALK